MSTRDIGVLGEKAAARYLKKQGYKIIERNLHISHNELDIVAINKRDKLIVFAEVKARSVDDELYSKFGSPASFVTKAKQIRTADAARAYLAFHSKFQKLQPRLDVIEIYLRKETLEILKINHIENAFGV